MLCTGLSLKRWTAVGVIDRVGLGVSDLARCVGASRQVAFILVMISGYNRCYLSCVVALARSCLSRVC